MMYDVKAKRWEHGWELHISEVGGAEVGVTQCRTLDRAEAVVWDYLETLLEVDTAGATVTVVPDLGGYESEVRYVRALVDDAATAQRKAGQHSRRVARQLRERGLSVTDTAAVLGVSRGRVSQLVKL